VLDDGQHDEIVGTLEARRAEALSRDLASPDGVTLRTYLRRLRWLVENGVMTRYAFIARQTALLPHETRSLLPKTPPSFLPLTFTQRQLATRIDVTLDAEHFVYNRRSLLNGSERFTLEYRNLREPAMHEETDRQIELTGILLLWAGAIVVVWGSWMQHGQPTNYYVGGIGLQRAIVDFGPILLFALCAAAIIPWFTQLRIGRPWPGVSLIRDSEYQEIVSAIADRRLIALRALARPDPLLHPQEQVQLLDELHEAGILDDEEHARAVAHAEVAFGDPALDEPVNAAPAAARDRVLH